MSEIPQSLRELAEAKAAIEAWRVRREAIDAEFRVLRDRQEAAVAARFAELSDEDLLSDEALRRWALENETYDSGTYQRMRALAAPQVPRDPAARVRQP